MKCAPAPLQGARTWSQHMLPGRIRPRGCAAQARPARRELQPSGMNMVLISHMKKKESIRKEQLLDSLPLGNEQTSANQSKKSRPELWHPLTPVLAALPPGDKGSKVQPLPQGSCQIWPKRCRWVCWSHAALVLNAAGPMECLWPGSALGGKMLFRACACTHSLGPSWCADAHGVCSVTMGTGCPGAGRMAPGKPNPGDDPGGSPVLAPGFAPEAAAALLSQAVGHTPGRALHCHCCPWAVPCSPPHRGAQQSGLGWCSSAPSDLSAALPANERQKSPSQL